MQQSRSIPVLTAAHKLPVLRTVLLKDGFRLAVLAARQCCTTTGLTANRAQTPSLAMFLRLYRSLQLCRVASVCPACTRMKFNGCKPIAVPAMYSLKGKPTTGEAVLMNQDGNKGVTLRKIMQLIKWCLCFCSALAKASIRAQGKDPTAPSVGSGTQWLLMLHESRACSCQAIETITWQHCSSAHDTSKGETATHKASCNQQTCVRHDLCDIHNCFLCHNCNWCTSLGSSHIGIVQQGLTLTTSLDNQ